jgi:hypothetical protein
MKAAAQDFTCPRVIKMVRPSSVSELEENGRPFKCMCEFATVEGRETARTLRERVVGFPTW